MNALISLVGQNFGKLKVIEKSERIGKRVGWFCKCECGNTIKTSGDKLTSGKTKSCGCIKKEWQKEFGKKHGIKPVHGMTHTSTYKSWGSMIARTSSGKEKRYDNYLGMCCDEWKNFKNFYNDMGDRPTGTTLDRIDVKKGYYKENCRWATPKVQANNRTNTRYLLVNGNKIALMDWAKSLNLKKNEAQYFYTVLKKIEISNQEVLIWNG